MQGAVTDDVCRTEQAQTMAIADAIAQRIGQQKYRIWFKNSTKLALADGYLKVGVANPFIANWIESHFSSEIAQAACTVTGGDCRVVFNVDSQLAGQQRRTQLDSSCEPAATCGSQTPEGKNTRCATGKIVSNRLKLCLETFVVGPTNELAYNAAKAVINDKQSPFNPLFIHGGYGVGKTHLLQGICNQVHKTRHPVNWLYMSAEDFANQFVLALKTRKLEAFRGRLRQTDLLAIDDIHFLASKPATQEEFLHTFNTIDLAGKQVVLASDAHPKMIGQISDKLVSRFISGMVVKIDPPDFAMRCEICKRYATILRKHIPEGVIQYIAENLRSNIRELQGALLKLIAFSSLQNGKIDLNTAREVLAEHLEKCDPIVHISDIASAVAEHFGITPNEIHSARKDRTVAMARHFTMYFARKRTKMSSSEIGRFLGDKNHATVLMGCKKVEEQIRQDTQLHWQGPDGNKVSRARTILAKLEKTIAG
jgi:chromosomal replication initiator protein